jgi:hypothetical protein
MTKPAFFDTRDVEGLADLMRKAVVGEPVFRPVIAAGIALPYSRNWEELWDIPFSPYAATARIIVPYYVVMLATCMSMAPLKKVAVVTGNATSKAKRQISAAIAPSP